MTSPARRARAMRSRMVSLGHRSTSNSFRKLGSVLPVLPHILREGFEAISRDRCGSRASDQDGASRTTSLDLAWNRARTGGKSCHRCRNEDPPRGDAASREIVEATTMLLAVVVLFSVSYWLISKVEAAEVAEIHSRESEFGTRARRRQGARARRILRCIVKARKRRFLPGALQRRTQRRSSTRARHRSPDSRCWRWFLLSSIATA